jgi:hypothetical protein
MRKDPTRLLLARPGIPTCHPAWLLPPPPNLVTGGKGDCTALLTNRKKPGAFSLHRNLPGGGVYSMTAPHMEHGAKPPGSFLPTPCFRPIKHLKLRALGSIGPMARDKKVTPEPVVIDKCCTCMLS